jgi:hypothetical protein
VGNEVGRHLEDAIAARAQYQQIDLTTTSSIKIRGTDNTSVVSFGGPQDCDAVQLIMIKFGIARTRRHCEYAVRQEGRGRSYWVCNETSTRVIDLS